MQTVRQLYELSSEEEVLALLADVTSYVSGKDPPTYPRRLSPYTLKLAQPSTCQEHAPFHLLSVRSDA